MALIPLRLGLRLRRLRRLVFLAVHRDVGEQVVREGLLQLA